MGKIEIGLYIGRFQPLHNGHLNEIERMLNDHNKLNIIVVGSADRHLSHKNPFYFSEIKEMIEKSVDSVNSTSLKIISMSDYINDYERWKNELFKKIFKSVLKKFPEFQTIDDARENTIINLYGYKKDESSFYLQDLTYYRGVMSKIKNKTDDDPCISLNASDIRNIMSYALKSSFIDYAKEIIPSGAMKVLIDVYDRVKETIYSDFEYLNKMKEMFKDYPFKEALNFVTVDFVLYSNKEVLCIERKFNPGKKSYAVPGGFLNNNESSLDGALRELSEETGIKLNKKEIEDSVKYLVFDHPQRSLYGRRLSIVFYLKMNKKEFKKIKKEAKAGDDAEKIKFLNIKKEIKKPLSNGEYLKFFDDHREIILLGIEKIEQGKQNGQ